MNGLTPNCLDDFLFSNPTDRQKLELILQRKLPFPFGGKSGILLHGTWGTGKSTLAKLLPELLEVAYANTWDTTQSVSQMSATNPFATATEVFSCGGGLSSTAITHTISKFNSRMPLEHYSRHNYFVFDEVEQLTVGAQQSLRSTMDLPRCMFFFTSNYLSKIDKGIVNRCHIVEMNQVTAPNAYIPLGQNILKNMGVAAGVVADTTLQGHASQARGSMRSYTHSVVMEGLNAGGVMPAKTTVV